MVSYRKGKLYIIKSKVYEPDNGVYKFIKKIKNKDKYHFKLIKLEKDTEGTHEDITLIIDKEDIENETYEITNGDFFYMTPNARKPKTMKGGKRRRTKKNKTTKRRKTHRRR